MQWQTWPNKTYYHWVAQRLLSQWHDYWELIQPRVWHRIYEVFSVRRCANVLLDWIFWEGWSQVCISCFFYFYSHKNVCSILSLALLIHRQNFWCDFFWSKTVLWARVLFSGLFSIWRLIESIFIGVASWPWIANQYQIHQWQTCSHNDALHRHRLLLC